MSLKSRIRRISSQLRLGDSHEQVMILLPYKEGDGHPPGSWVAIFSGGGSEIIPADRLWDFERLHGGLAAEELGRPSESGAEIPPAGVTS